MRSCNLASCLPFTIDDLRIARLFIPFFFQISYSRYLNAVHRSVTIVRSKDACWPRNFWSHACTIYFLFATVSVTVVEYYLYIKPREYFFSQWVFNEIPVIVLSWWYPAGGDNPRTVALWKKGGTVRPLSVPELLVKFDNTYRATLWLRNPWSNRRLHN